MSVIKRIRKNQDSKTTFYTAEIYVGGVRLQSKTFENASAAHVWHDREKIRLENGNPNEAINSLDFRECFERYKREAFTCLRKSSQQSMAIRFRYFTEGTLNDVKMADFSDRTVDDWL